MRPRSPVLATTNYTICLRLTQSSEFVIEVYIIDEWCTRCDTYDVLYALQTTVQINMFAIYVRGTSICRCGAFRVHDPMTQFGFIEMVHCIIALLPIRHGTLGRAHTTGTFLSCFQTLSNCDCAQSLCSKWNRGTECAHLWMFILIFGGCTFCNGRALDAKH